MFDSLWFRAAMGHRTGAFGVHAKATSAELIKHFCRLGGLRKLMPMPSCGEPCPTNDFKPMVGETKKNNLKGHGISFAGPATLYNSSIWGLFWRVSWNGHMTWHASTTPFPTLRNAAICASLALIKRVAQCYTFVSRAQWSGWAFSPKRILCELPSTETSWKGFEPERLAVVWA